MDIINKTFVDGVTVIDAAFLNELVTKLNALITGGTSGSGSSSSTDSGSNSSSSTLGKVNINLNTSNASATLSAANSTKILYTLVDGGTPNTEYSSAITLADGNVLTAIATNGSETTSTPKVSATFNSNTNKIALSVSSGTITYKKDSGSVASYSEALDASVAATYVIYVDGVEATTITITA